MNTIITAEQATEALANGTGEAIRIAILDSGVETSHPALAGLALQHDLAFLDDGPSVRVVPGEGRDVYGHGTAIASILRRLAPEATLGSFRVLGSKLSSRTHIIREGVRHALREGYHILNCSFGCRGSEQFVLRYKDWADEAYLRNVHVVAACNNFDVSEPEWPSHFASVISVNMAKVEDDRLLYRSRGHIVEFAARGTGLSLPWLNGTTYPDASGSSYATPAVAALCARILSRYPTVSASALKAVLQQVALPMEDRLFADNVTATR